MTQLLYYESYERPNKFIRRMELMLKRRREFHRPTRAEKNPRAYTRKEKHRANYLEMTNE